MKKVLAIAGGFVAVVLLIGGIGASYMMGTYDTAHLVY